MLPAHLHVDMTIDEADATTALLTASRDVGLARAVYGFGSAAHRHAVGVYHFMLAYLRAARQEARV